MTTTPAMPELPEPDRTMWQHGKQIDHYTADQMRAYARAALSSQPSPELAGVSDVIAMVRERYRGTKWGKAAECICDAVDEAILAPRPQAVAHEDWPLRAKVWRRDSTSEWVLEISGTLCDTYMHCRHTQPLSVQFEDVPGLPTLYEGAQAVRMTDEQIVAAFKACDLEDPSKEGWIWRTRIKWARAIEAHHGITAKGAQEGV